MIIRIFLSVLSLVRFLPDNRVGMRLRNIYFRLIDSRVPKSTRIHSGAIIHKTGNLFLGEFCVIGKGTEINPLNSHGVYIGNHFLSAPNVYVRSANHNYFISQNPIMSSGHVAKKIVYKDNVYSVVVEDNVWVGRGACILSGSHIGEGSVIGANAVVKGYIPPKSIVYGNPGVIIANREEIRNLSQRDDIDLFD